MDYSLLLGIHNTTLDKEPQEENNTGKVFFNTTVDNLDRVSQIKAKWNSQAYLATRCQLPNRKIAL
jgi:hypothetical protein